MTVPINGRSGTRRWAVAASLICALAAPSANPATADASGSELIRFDAEARLSTRFRDKRVMPKGAAPDPAPTVTLQGRLDLPDGAPPHPAVILASGCDADADWLAAWRARLRAWGYATLTFDSLGPRGVETLCEDPALLTPARRGRDLLGAARRLAERPDIDAGRIGALGQTHGAWAALFALTPAQTGGDQPLSAVVALYPLCGPYSGFLAPVWALQAEQSAPGAAYICADALPRVPSYDEITVRSYPETTHPIGYYFIRAAYPGDLTELASSTDRRLVSEIHEFLDRHLQGAAR